MIEPVVTAISGEISIPQDVPTLIDVAGRLLKYAEELKKDRDYLLDKNQWMMMFHINEQGHLMYEQVTGVPIDFIISENGHLLVEVAAT